MRTLGRLGYLIERMDFLASRRSYTRWIRMLTDTGVLSTPIELFRQYFVACMRVLSTIEPPMEENTPASYVPNGCYIALNEYVWYYYCSISSPMHTGTFTALLAKR